MDGPTGIFLFSHEIFLKLFWCKLCIWKLFLQHHIYLSSYFCIKNIGNVVVWLEIFWNYCLLCFMEGPKTKRNPWFLFFFCSSHYFRQKLSANSACLGDRKWKYISENYLLITRSLYQMQWRLLLFCHFILVALQEKEANLILLFYLFIC